MIDVRADDDIGSENSLAFAAAGHNAHIDEPLLVVQAIRDLAQRCRAAAIRDAAPRLTLSASDPGVTWCP